MRVYSLESMVAGVTLVVCLLVAVVGARAEVELGAPFADNGVLQREQPVPVWGWANPGTKATVTFGKQKKAAMADASGKWMLELAPLEASFKPQAMHVAYSSGESTTVKNLLVGEVWLASGQSNMQWKVSKSNCTKLETKPRDGVHPIREFEITSVYAMLHPIERATGAWKDGTYPDYSAIAYAFAHKLYNELNVPIGILNCSFSQTAIQAWIPHEGYQSGTDAYTKEIYQQILVTDPTTFEHAVAWKGYYRQLEDKMNANKDRIKNGEQPREIRVKPPGNLNGNRDATWLFNGRLNPVVPFAVRGCIWNQGYANMGEGLPYYNNLHSMIRGWRIKWNQPELPVYFHQFYAPGQKGGWKDNTPTINSTAEMRLGTWLARDIPNAGMASQIDITGGIHYRHKAVPGQRLALHALKNQYASTTLKNGQKAASLITEGPSYQSYTVEGNKLIVSFTDAAGGLVVAEAGTNALTKEGSGLAEPIIVDNGDSQVKVFYLAGADRIWHPATAKIQGNKAVVTSPDVPEPLGVSYATRGVAFQPALYNKALLPAAPFIYYNNELVTRKTWPNGKLKIAGQKIDPASIGKRAEYYKMPLLSTQFRDNAVLQAGRPLTIWGSCIHPWGYEAEGKAEIRFSFAGTNKTIAVKPGMREWRVTLPPMPASAKPQTLKATFYIDGELVHERVCENVVLGDVWYVAAPSMKLGLPKSPETNIPVRVMRRKAKRSSFARPSRFSVCVSTTPKNRFACVWQEEDRGLAAVLGRQIAAKTGRPVGIIYMESSASKTSPNPTLKEWISVDFLDQSPTLAKDYRIVGSQFPGTPYYNDNVRRYITDWKTYWSSYIPAMMRTKSVPDNVPWGHFPAMTGGGAESTASRTYNVMTHSFTPTSLAGMVFVSGPDMVSEDAGANFSSEIHALAKCWQSKFGTPGAPILYTAPNQSLAAKVGSLPKANNTVVPVEIERWDNVDALLAAVLQACN